MPGFTFPKLEALKNNYSELVNKLLEKHHILDVNLLPQHRQAQLARIEAALHEAEEIKQPFNTEQCKSAVVLGVYLEIKDEIESSYTTGFTAALLRTNRFTEGLTDPARSGLYEEINSAMGVSEENPLDEESRQMIMEIHNNVKDHKGILPEIKNSYESDILSQLVNNSNELKPVKISESRINGVMYAQEKVNDSLKDFDKQKLNKTDTRESQLFFEGVLKQYPKCASQSTSDAPAANTTCKM